MLGSSRPNACRHPAPSTRPIRAGAARYHADILQGYSRSIGRFGVLAVDVVVSGSANCTSGVVVAVGARFGAAALLDTQALNSTTAITALLIRLIKLSGKVFTLHFFLCYYHNKRSYDSNKGSAAEIVRPLQLKIPSLSYCSIALRSAAIFSATVPCLL